MFSRKTKRDRPKKAVSAAEHRQEMVERQIRSRGVSDPRVLAAMAEVPREAFVPNDLQSEAYEDQPLPIGGGQTISQPYTVAFMAKALELRSSDRVLEIGTGSGYSAAVLGRLATEVHSIERIELLARNAEEILSGIGATGVHVHIGDGTLGWKDAAPYDAIIVTAGASALPLDYIDQLADGGRVVIPLGHVRHRQTLFRFRLRGRELEVSDLGRFAFVPLVGEHGWSDSAG